jgi:hypothetical protein
MPPSIVGSIVVAVLLATLFLLAPHPTPPGTPFGAIVAQPPSFPAAAAAGPTVVASTLLPLLPSADAASSAGTRSFARDGRTTRDRVVGIDPGEWAGEESDMG